MKILINIAKNSILKHQDPNVFTRELVKLIVYSTTLKYVDCVETIKIKDSRYIRFTGDTITRIEGKPDVYIDNISLQEWNKNIITDKGFQGSIYSLSQMWVSCKQEQTITVHSRLYQPEYHYIWIRSFHGYGYHPYNHKTNRHLVKNMQAEYNNQVRLDRYRYHIILKYPYIRQDPFGFLSSIRELGLYRTPRKKLKWATYRFPKENSKS